MSVAYSIENHPADSRVNIDECGKVQCLTSRMGTGGGNVPLVMEEKEVVPIHDMATRFAGRRGEKKDGKGNGIGVGEPGDPMNTLTSGDRHAVAYSMKSIARNGKPLKEQTNPICASDYKDPDIVAYTQQTYQKVTGPLMANSHPGSYTGQDAFSDMLIAGEKSFGIDCRNMNEYTELYPTLQAKPNGGQSLNFSGAVRQSYIVRRLTPTECARLQGFPDEWGHISRKEELNDEEYAFWTEVRCTHAVINGREPKTYNRKQMLAWYNKLHTDSAEYKMWGNGIALPPAVYCMQGIAEALKE